MKIRICRNAQQKQRTELRSARHWPDKSTFSIVLKIKYFMAILILLTPVMSADMTEPKKVVILSMKFETSNLLLENSIIEYGSPPNKLPNEDGLLFNIFSDKGVVLDSYRIGDPRFLYDIGYVENVSFAVILPYKSLAKKIEVMDEDKNIASIDLTGSFSEFCKTKNDICDIDCKDDVDCPTKKTEPIKSEDYSYLIIIALILLSIVLFFGYRKIKETSILKEVRKIKRR